MKLIFDNLPMENEEKDGGVEFIMDGYYYHIGELDGIHWISRKTIEDYQNDIDNWEKVSSWIPEKQRPFKLLRGNKLPYRPID
jgi:hypothetical protein